jgi:hypothetical protein
MSLLRPLRSFIRVFQRLLGMFVPALMIAFRVLRGGSPVRVRGELVELGSSLVRVIWHWFPHLWRPFNLPPFHFFHCSILNMCPAHPIIGWN